MLTKEGTYIVIIDDGNVYFATCETDLLTVSTVLPSHGCEDTDGDFLSLGSR